MDESKVYGMSEQPDQLPNTIDELIPFIFRHSGSSLGHTGPREAATTKVFTLLVRDSLVPTLNDLSKELAETYKELREAAASTTKASRSLFKLTVVYVVATVLYTVATIWQVYSVLFRSIGSL